MLFDLYTNRSDGKKIYLTAYPIPREQAETLRSKLLPETQATTIAEAVHVEQIEQVLYNALKSGRCSRRQYEQAPRM